MKVDQMVEKEKRKKKERNSHAMCLLQDLSLNETAKGSLGAIRIIYLSCYQIAD